MKLLLDQNLSPRLAPALADLYPGSIHVQSAGLEQASDDVIWGYAKRHGFAIVTRDADFADQALLRSSPPQVIWIRTGNCPTSHILNLLRTHVLPAHQLLADEHASVLVIGPATHLSQS